MSPSDECICGETNARNCPVHQGDKRPREWWIIPDNKVLFTNRYHIVLDAEQASHYQAGWDSEFGLPKNAIHVVEALDYEQVLKERDKWYERFAELEIKRASCCEQVEKERDELRKDLARLVGALEMIAHNEAPEENTGGVSKGLAKAALADYEKFKEGK